MPIDPLCLLPLTAITAYSQKVGLVLSGGGAKGIAHVGVLKALEENEIPIDYVTGTSMGGIVAGCYAAGMSPQQIEEIMLSKEFIGWVTGRLEQGYNYYYNRPDDNPSVLKINLSLDSTFNFNLNSSIANDLSLNFALAEVMAQPAAIARGNFDSLFVPLRVVAADVFTQTEVIFEVRKFERRSSSHTNSSVLLFANQSRQQIFIRWRSLQQLPGRCSAGCFQTGYHHRQQRVVESVR
ncbi:MAG: patatin-like phospholipase family protein [Bacteroidota bacterium]